MKHVHVLSAAAALLVVATAAQAQRGHDDRRNQDQHQDQHAQVPPPAQQRRGDVDRGRDIEGQQQAVDRNRAEQARAAEMQNQRRVVQDDEQRRDLQMRQRAQQEQQEQIQRSRRAQQDEQFERARRVQDEERIEQERRAELNRSYDRDRDDRAGYNYRYNVGGVYRETNQFGVDALRQALDLGYRDGYRAGLTDRRDGAPADYRRAFEFQYGGFGYSGGYVPQSDYSYYLGQGFQRGYDDAYWNRAQYGTYYNGTPSILGNIVAGILGLTMIR